MANQLTSIKMLILGFVWIFLLEEAFCFIQSDIILQAPQYCSDDEDCSLLNCNFVVEARKHCPKKCGFCHVCEDTIDDCSSLVNICNSSHVLPVSAVICPKSCKFCDPCMDTNNTICSGLKKFCNYNVDVVNKCPKTCNRCKAYNATRIIEAHKTTHMHTMKTGISSTTATITFTAAPPASTLPPTAIASKVCDRIGLLVSIAQESAVSRAGTPSCPDGVHHPSEALVQKYCSAPKISDWVQGEKVMKNCHNVPHYTAIAASTSTFGGAPVAGIFIKCETDGFEAAIQSCDSSLKIYHVPMRSTSNIPSADRFVVINWN